MIPTRKDLEAAFPAPEIRAIQGTALAIMAEMDEASGGALLELPTGEGKTYVGLALLRALAAQGQYPLYYATPTKAQVEQVAKSCPEATVTAFGRGDHPCLYYAETDDQGQTRYPVDAAMSPCYMLTCPHRVNLESGEQMDPHVPACPYLQAKFDAQKKAETEGRIVVCTTAFFLMNRLFVPTWRDLPPAAVVLDEAHLLPQIARRLQEYRVTDWHLNRLAETLQPYEKEQAETLRQFTRCFCAIAATRPNQRNTMLDQDEIAQLLAIAQSLDETAIRSSVKQAADDGLIDVMADRDLLKMLEGLVRGIPRLIRSLGYATDSPDRRALDYVMVYTTNEGDGESRRARHSLTFRQYYVGSLVRRLAGNLVLGLSATFGNPEVYGWESGLKLPFHSLGASFPPDKTRLYVPTDTPDLGRKRARRDDPKNALKAIVTAARAFLDEGLRSMVVVVSDEERTKMAERAERAGLDPLTYGNGVAAKDVVQRFLTGEGGMLIGTAAQYGHGIDLPDGVAPVIFFLRPGYQRPDDPQTLFEQRRFSGGHCWGLWQHRVMMEALQVRGRNVRSAGDLGICIFVSQQFRGFVYHALPEWLKPAYVNDKTMAEITADAIALLKPEIDIALA